MSRPHVETCSVAERSVIEEGILSEILEKSEVRMLT